MRSTRPLVWWVLMWAFAGCAGLLVPERVYPVALQYVGLPVVVGLIVRKRLRAPIQMDDEGEVSGS